MRFCIIITVVLCMASSAFGQQKFKGEYLGAAAIGAAAGALTGLAVRGKHHESKGQQCHTTLGTLTTHFQSLVTNDSPIPFYLTIFGTDPLCKVVELPAVQINPSEALPVSLDLIFENPIEGTYHFGIQFSSQTGQAVDATLVQPKEVVLYVDWAPLKGKSVHNDLAIGEFNPTEPFFSQIQLNIPFTFGHTVGN